MPTVPIADCAAASRPFRLTDVERMVVNLSRWDARSSLKERHPWQAGVARWLGVQEHNALADPYLEALRRYAVASRLRHREAGLDVHLLLVAGFSIGQADEVETLVGPWRVGPDSSHRWKGLIILGAFALGVYVAALDALDDQLLAFILVGVLLAMIVPFVLPTRRDH